ncbi:MAG: glycosyltransferase family 4 protein [Candidatus Vogelbacteria bacterium]|nr:glycosyltransferase family 4 protein [Candidatus Vogelbacteria bacterium]
MKIAILIRRLNVRGGAQRQALWLARCLIERGHAVTLYTFIYDKANCYEELLYGMRVIEQYGERELASRIENGTEVVNPHGEEVYRTAALYKKAHPHVRSIWMMNDMATRYPSYLRAREVDQSIMASRVKVFAYRLLDWRERALFIAPQDDIVVLDERDRAWVMQYYRKEAEVVRSGICVTEFPFTLRALRRERPLKALAVGILFAHRRFEDLIVAVNILKSKGYDMTLSIVGGDADLRYKERLVSLIASLHLENTVTLLGAVSGKELLGAYAGHDVFVFPSHLQSWGIAVFEAMASGMPVIVSRTAGASEVLTDGENALLVSPKSPSEIAAAIEQLFNKPELTPTLSKAGRKFVEENISWGQYTERMLDIFRR